ncbi:MAG: hypothetical protein U1E76_21660 [Planctomycetota bacterium]
MVYDSVRGVVVLFGSKDGSKDGETMDGSNSTLRAHHRPLRRARATRWRMTARAA